MCATLFIQGKNKKSRGASPTFSVQNIELCRSDLTTASHILDPFVSPQAQEGDDPFEALVDSCAQEHDWQRGLEHKGSQRRYRQHDHPAADHVNHSYKTAVASTTVDAYKAACVIAGADER